MSTLSLAGEIADMENDNGWESDENEIQLREEQTSPLVCVGFLRNLCLRRRKQKKLGDSWIKNDLLSSSSTSSSTSLAVPLHSVEFLFPRIDRSPGDDVEKERRALRLVFRNNTMEPLVLCWVDRSGSWHHFYPLPPQDGDHVENTYIGDAFVLAMRRRSDRQDFDEEVSDAGKVEDGDHSSDQYPLIEGGHLPSSVPDEELVALAAYRPMTLYSNPQHSSSKGRRAVHFVCISQQSALWCCLCGQNGWAPLKHCRRKWVLTIRDDSLDSHFHLNERPFDTTNKIYEAVDIDPHVPFSVRCEPRCWEKGGRDESRSGKDLRDRIISDIIAASNDLPPHALDLLRTSTSFWINKSQKFGPSCDPVVGRGMCFHPDSAWLRKVGMSTDKAGGIEMYCAGEYLDDCDLWGPGGVILHELSHAYHHHHVDGGYNNIEIRDCYKRAMERGLYDCIPVHGPQGPTARAYACENPMEFFAELSVAFLGGKASRAEHNKWFPFTRAQLKDHDSEAYDMLKRIWKVDDSWLEEEEVRKQD